MADLLSTLDRAISNLDNAKTELKQEPVKESIPTQEEEEVADIDDEEDGGVKYKPPKGSTDYHPEDMVIREGIMMTVKEVLRRCGCAQLETPVFELKETLCGSIGEDEKLIFELKDQGGELLALRYDHTVPLARYVAKNRKKFKTTLRAARIGRVYRRDQPNKKKGRLREFYQCDLDIVRFGMPASASDLIVDDAECVNMVCSCLTELIGRDGFKIMINNRKLFDCVLTLLGVGQDSFRAIGSSVDKMDKKSWEEVRQEMLDKGLTGEQADGLKKYLDKKGVSLDEMLKGFRQDKALMGVEGFSAALDEMALLWKYIELYGWADKVTFDMSMVRGLDYYTGMILEGTLTEECGIGSISGGGRYDKLVNRFCDGDFPCVGASIGFERLFSYLKMKQEAAGKALKPTCTQVLVAEATSKGSEANLLAERIKLLQELRRAGISAELYPKDSPNFRSQIEYCESWGIPFFVIIGEDEIKNGTCNVNRLLYPGDTVQIQGKNMTITKIEGKFVYIKKEKRKKGSVKGVVSESGSVCGTKNQGVPRKELVAFLKNNL